MGDIGRNHYLWKDASEYHYFKYQPIKWRVISDPDYAYAPGGHIRLMADKALDNKQYHSAEENVTWEESTIRSWLNGYSADKNKQKKDYSKKNFIDTVFNASEQLAIKTQIVTNELRDSGCSSSAFIENNTKDKICLPSFLEAFGTERFTDGVGGPVFDEACMTKSTVYAKIQGAYVDRSSLGTKSNC